MTMRCPTCNSSDPRLHPALQYEGEVELCGDPFHQKGYALKRITTNHRHPHDQTRGTPMTLDEKDLLSLIRQFSLRRATSRDHPFTLASGRKSDYLIDLKPLMLTPPNLRLISRVLFRRIMETWPTARLVAGVTLGGVPLAVGVSMLSMYACEAKRTASAFSVDVPTTEMHWLSPLLIRKEAKTHGTGSLIECPILDSSIACDVVLLEDVVTTGGSSVRSLEAVEATGQFRVVGVLAIVDREERNPEDIKSGLLTSYCPKPLVSLFTGAQVKGE